MCLTPVHLGTARLTIPGVVPGRAGPQPALGFIVTSGDKLPGQDTLDS
jgi:hypothetical protein